MAKTYFEVLKRASSFLKELGKDDYAPYYLLFERKGWNKTDWLLHMKDEIPDVEEAQIHADLNSLQQDYPPQYLLGYSEFYGHRFVVSEDTLIPRPETEELVEYCLNENLQNKLTVVDVGTGTGAIAISLKLARPDWQITAVDLSKEALAVAAQNSEALAASIELVLGDGLAPVLNKEIDILISNPPYISLTEWQLMDQSVKKYEPKQALFAEDDGLAIYKQLVKEAANCLKPAGKIYFEIGFQQGAAVKALIQEKFPNKQVRVEKDLSGNDRMVIAE
ncbi:peptide chain release factor N(5)-glutamine methyltransferase [Enterococcus sp. LJL51]|uniref:peptide chain release factor N(5)-glutamine methyltransferase n=1 Tax=Enterococcus sp. LJL51 TaxID=3416656 RepID=UPI003CEB6B2E